MSNVHLENLKHDDYAMIQKQGSLGSFNLHATSLVKMLTRLGLIQQANLVASTQSVRRVMTVV